MSEPYPGWVKKATLKCKLGIHEWGGPVPYPDDASLWVERCLYCGKRRYWHERAKKGERHGKR